MSLVASEITVFIHVVTGMVQDNRQTHLQVEWSALGWGEQYKATKRTAVCQTIAKKGQYGRREEFNSFLALFLQHECCTHITCRAV